MARRRKPAHQTRQIVNVNVQTFKSTTPRTSSDSTKYSPGFLKQKSQIINCASNQEKGLYQHGGLHTNNKPSLSNEEEVSILPVWTPWLVSAITLIFRVCHVIDPSSWWVLHPDEIFQSMEVAHSELYGYGLRPYEFNPPPQRDNLSHYQMKEQAVGMYALRSPIIPQYMIVATWFCHMIGCDTSNPYLLFRLSHIVITSTLPLAVSRYAFSVTRSPDIGRLAAILVGASAYLNVMGTHTLVNSFVSPALFWGFSGLLFLLREKVEIKFHQQGSKVNLHSASNTDTRVCYQSDCNRNTEQDLYESYINDTAKKKNQRTPDSKDTHVVDKSDDFNYYELPNIVTPSCNIQNTNGCKIKNIYCDKVKKSDFLNSYKLILAESKSGIYPTQHKNDMSSKSESPHLRLFYKDSIATNGLQKARLTTTGVLSKLWCSMTSTSRPPPGPSCPEGLQTGRSYNRHGHLKRCMNQATVTHPAINRACTEQQYDHVNNCLYSTVKHCHDTQNNDLHFLEFDDSDNPPITVKTPEKNQTNLFANRFRSNLYVIDNIVCGCLLTLALYIRPDTALVVSIVSISFFRLSLSYFSKILRDARAWCLLFGGILGFIFAVVSDFIFYYAFVITAINWVRLNLFSGMSAQLFGTSDWMFYLRQVFFHDMAMSVLTLFVLLTTIYYIIVRFGIKRSVIMPDKIVTSNNHQTKVDKDMNTSKPKGYKENGTVSTTARSPSSNKTITTSNNEWYSKIDTTQNNSDRSFIVHTTCLIVTLMLYSCVGHKEERFLHDIVVLFLLTVSEAILKWTNFVFKHNDQTSAIIHLNKAKRDLFQGQERMLKRFTIFVISCVFIVSQIHTFHKSTTKENKEWMFSSTASGLDTSSCLFYISKQTDVRGVFIDRSFQDTGGYSLLHKDVPLIYAYGSGYMEFTHSSKYMDRKSCVLCLKNTPVYYDDRIRLKNYTCSSNHSCANSSVNNIKSCPNNSNFVSYYNLNTISDFIYKDNKARLIKKIVESEIATQKNHFNENQAHHPTDLYHVNVEKDSHQQTHRHKSVPLYNYAIVKAGKDFLTPLFEPVYKTSTMWLWHRVNSSVENESISQHFISEASSVRTRSSNISRGDDQTNSERTNDVSFTHTLTSGNNVQQKDNEKINNHNRTLKHNDENGTKMVYTTSNKNGVNEASNHHIYNNRMNTHTKSAPNQKNLRLIAVLEYEGEVLKQMGNYWQSLQRFEEVSLMTKGFGKRVHVSVLASMAFCFHKMGETKNMQKIILDCMTSYSRDLCLDGGRARVANLWNGV